MTVVQVKESSEIFICCKFRRVEHHGKEYIRGMVPHGPGDDSIYTNMNNPVPVVWVAAFTLKMSEVVIIEEAEITASEWEMQNQKPPVVISQSDKDWRLTGRN